MSNGNGLPNGWCLAAIEQLNPPDRTCAYGVLQPGEDLEHGIPFVRVCDVADGKVAITQLKLISPAISERYQRTILRGGEVLLTIVGTIGRTAVASEALKGANTARAVAVIPIAEPVDPSYVELALRDSRVRVRLTQAAHEVARKTLNLEDVRATRIPLAPLNEQRRIVAKIEELFSDLDAGVAALERVKAKLKRYRAAVLKAAVEGKLTEAWRKKNRPKETGQQLLARILQERRCRWEHEQRAAYEKAGKKPPAGWKDRYKEPVAPDESRLPELPADWCWASVAQIAEVQGGIQKQPKRKPVQNAYPFLRVANVYRNRLDLSEVHQIELFGDELERLRLRAGDLLIVEGNGSITEIGRSALWLGGIENCVHQNHIIRVRFLAGHPGYLNAFWNSPAGNARVMESAASTSGLYTLSVAKVSSLPVPIAPACEQEHIVAEVDQRLSNIEETDKQIAATLKRSARLRQSILKRAFEGKLVPQDPNDEPASVLLDRIKAGRDNSTGRTNGAARTRLPRRSSSRKQQEENA